MKSLLLLLVSLLLASCGTIQAVLDLPHPPVASTSTPAPTPEPAPVQLQPAPPGLSNAQARRYYAAQLDALKAGVPAKVKNSNNTTTTVEQKISNVGAAQLLAMIGLSLCLGFVLGAVIGRRTTRLATL